MTRDRRRGSSALYGGGDSRTGGFGMGAPFGFGFSYGAASSVAGTSSSRGGHYGYDGRRGETVEEEDDHTVQCNQM